MTRPVLVLRPQPAADDTAERARTLGLEPIVAPLFRIVCRDWTQPTEAFDALLVTSANAVRCLGRTLATGMRAYAVGPATAAALRELGFTDVVAGSSDIIEIVARARRDGVRTMLHLAGEHRTAFDPGPIQIETRVVYASEAIDVGPAFDAALDVGAVALLHSSRAAQRFRQLAGPGRRIAAISAKVLEAAGGDWEAGVIADRPTDDALLAAAARLCQ